MPYHHSIPFDLNEGRWKFLRNPDVGFSAQEIHRADRKNSNPRQQQFETELRRIARHFGTQRVPIYLTTSARGNTRLDLGCIGHAVANEVIEHPQNEPSGQVEWLTLR
jgi:hypothetical protein